MVFVDPDGELIWFVPALIGGALNLAANWDNIDNFALGIGYFTGGARGNDLLLAGAVGGVSGLVGGYGSQLASKYAVGIALNGLQVNSNSAIGGAIPGAIGGAAGGFTGGLLMTGNLSDAFDAGMKGLQSGAITGTVIGAGYGYYEANKAGLDPWTGKPIKSTVIGRAQKEWVNPTAKDLKSETISPAWDEEFGGRITSKRVGADFNKNWIEGQMNDGVHIFDAGRPPTSLDINSKFQDFSLYYDGAEHGAILKNSYDRYYRVRQIRIKVLPNGKSYYYYKTNLR